MMEDTLYRSTKRCECLDTADCDRCIDSRFLEGNARLGKLLASDESRWRHGRSSDVEKYAVSLGIREVALRINLVKNHFQPSAWRNSGRALRSSMIRLIQRNTAIAIAATGRIADMVHNTQQSSNSTQVMHTVPRRHCATPYTASLVPDTQQFPRTRG